MPWSHMLRSYHGRCPRARAISNKHKQAMEMLDAATKLQLMQLDATALGMTPHGGQRASAALQATATQAGGSPQDLCMQQHCKFCRQAHAHAPVAGVPCRCPQTLAKLLRCWIRSLVCWGGRVRPRPLFAAWLAVRLVASSDAVF